jgi:hypothetical protein
MSQPPGQPAIFRSTSNDEDTQGNFAEIETGVDDFQPDQEEKPMNPESAHQKKWLLVQRFSVWNHHLIHAGNTKHS